MAERREDVSIIFKLIDQFTVSGKRISDSLQNVSKSADSANKKVEELESTMREIQSFRKVKKETEDLKKALKDSGDSIGELRSKIKKSTDRLQTLEQQFKETGDGSEKMSKKIDAAKTRIDTLNRSLNSSIRTTENLSKRYEASAASTDKLRKSLADQGISTRNLRQETNELTRELVNAKRAQTSLENRQKSSIRVTTSLTNAQDRLNKVLNSSTGLLGSVARGVVGLVSAYVGFQAIGNTTRIVRDAEQSIFTLEASIRAANTEFKQVGSLQSWTNTVGRLRKQLKVFSETDLRLAVSRTVDMTKRLGLNEAQIRKVIVASADLSAGRTDLIGGIERTTAALRGEAESAEFLGLTLNETYVRAWFEANKQTTKAWKDLTDLEKAQIRYNILLEQAAGFAGKSAKSAETFNGRLAQLNATINDTVANSESLNEFLREISKELGGTGSAIEEFITFLIDGGVEIARFIVKNKELIAAVGGLALLTPIVSGLATGIGLLSKALLFLGSAEVAAALASLRTAFVAIGAGLATFSGPQLLAIAGGILIVTKTINDLVTVVGEWSAATKVAEGAQKRVDRALSKSIAKFKEFSNVPVPDTSDFATKTTSELKDMLSSMSKAVAFYRTLIIQDERAAKETNFFGRFTEEAIAAQDRIEKSKESIKKYQDAIGDIREILPATERELGNAFATPQKAVLATTKDIEKLGSEIEKAYTAATREADRFAKEQARIDDRLTKSIEDIEERRRRLGETVLETEFSTLRSRLKAGRDEVRRLDDLAAEARKGGVGRDASTRQAAAARANAKAAATRELARLEAEFVRLQKNTISDIQTETRGLTIQAEEAIAAQDFKQAEAIIKSIDKLYEDQAKAQQALLNEQAEFQLRKRREIIRGAGSAFIQQAREDRFLGKQQKKAAEESVRVSEQGLNELSRLSTLLADTQRDVAVSAEETLRKQAQDIESVLDSLFEKRELGLELDKGDITDAERTIDDLTKEETKTIRVKVVQLTSSGGGSTTPDPILSPPGFAKGMVDFRR